MYSMKQVVMTRGREIKKKTTIEYTGLYIKFISIALQKNNFAEA